MQSVTVRAAARCGFVLPDVASRFHIAFVEQKADYGMNLQFCCDHYRSVSEVCSPIVCAQDPRGHNR